MIPFRTVLLAAMVMTASVASGQQSPPVILHPGDPAPAFNPGKFIKGEPVKALAAGQVYVIFFWDQSCRREIPHITALQKQFKDVIFIGQYGRKEDPAEVADFMANMGEMLDFRVALHDGGKMMEAWYYAAGDPGFPASFVIDKQGRIAWMGHSNQLDRVLSQLVAGRFDPQAAAREMSFDALKEPIKNAYNTLAYPEALALVEKLATTAPSEASYCNLMRFLLQMKMREYPAATALVPQLLECFQNDATLLNAIAGMIVERKYGPDHPDLDLAEKFAQAAQKASDGKSAAIFETLARIRFLRGQLDEAVRLQSQALAMVHTDDNAEVHETLQMYKDRQKEGGIRDSDRAPIPLSELKVGDAAPPLRVGSWICGEPVKVPDAQHAYLVYFWYATTAERFNPPIEMLNDLQKSYRDKGLIVILMLVGDFKPGEKEAMFLEKKKSEIQFRIATDRFTKGALAEEQLGLHSPGFTEVTWIWASHEGFPAGLLVDKDGRVVWIGNPPDPTKDLLGRYLH